MKIERLLRNFALSLVASAMFLASCAAPPGMRLFQAEYRVDSELLLAVAYDESDSVPIPKLWESLVGAPMFPGDGGSGIVADPSDPLRMTLSGDIEVRIVHAGRQLSLAKVTELALIRDSAGNSLWYPAPGELVKLTGVATY